MIEENEQQEDPIARIERRFTEFEPQIMQAVLEGFYPRSHDFFAKLPDLAKKLTEQYDNVMFGSDKEGDIRNVRVDSDGTRIIIGQESVRFIITLGADEVDTERLADHTQYFSTTIKPILKFTTPSHIGTRVSMLFNQHDPRVQDFPRSKVLAPRLLTLLGLDKTKLRQFRIDFGDEVGVPGTVMELGLKEVKLELPATRFQGSKSIKFNGAVLDVIRPYNSGKLDKRHLVETIDMVDRIFTEIFGGEENGD